MKKAVSTHSRRIDEVGNCNDEDFVNNEKFLEFYEGPLLMVSPSS